MLKTNLEHLEAEARLEQCLREHTNVMICCGRMGPMCIPVYRAMENLEKRFPHVMFRDMEFDSPAADFIKNLPECTRFMSLPFTVYFRDGQSVAAGEDVFACGICLKSRMPDDSSGCPVSTMKDCLDMVLWAEKMVRFLAASFHPVCTSCVLSCYTRIPAPDNSKKTS